MFFYSALSVSVSGVTYEVKARLSEKNTTGHSGDFLAALPGSKLVPALQNRVNQLTLHWKINVKTRYIGEMANNGDWPNIARYTAN